MRYRFVAGIVGGAVLLGACSSPSPATSSGSATGSGAAPQTPASAQSAPADVPPPTTRNVTYSPYPAQTFPDRVYWGDTHLHTAYSSDAGMVGAILGPEEAYRFARGEEVKSNHGQPVKLRRPYDFLVVSDHAENLGLAPMIAESNPELLKSEWGRQVHDLVKAGKGPEAFNMWLAAMQALTDPLKDLSQPLAKPVWQESGTDP